ncbi:hypothetical protein CEP54_004481 [Fusarium duplospermum]|uniref:Uncharacterized protein n=1 Tax=Fusarium duplospermum TaxID=1325734 RepID=A0A428QIM1_9HYPO|nr:hypothetical protein CEP54_004481 [Fusarium duplospermum]
MDLTLDPLVDSNDTPLDLDEFDTPANAPRRSAAIDLESGLEVALEASGNGGSGGGGSGNFVYVDVSDDDNGDVGSLFNNYDDDQDSHTAIANSESLFVVDSDSELEPAMELAVDASGNGGGGGRSSNVVCAAMSDDSDESVNSWTREDAINGLKVEFWMYHPDRILGETAHHHEDISVGSDHPHYDLYLQILGLIQQYFAEINSGGEARMVVRIKDRVKDAFDAFRAGGYSVDGRHWAEILPDRAELMLTRFAVSYDSIDRSIARMLGAMGRIRMLYIEG